MPFGRPLRGRQMPCCASIRTGGGGRRSLCSRKWMSRQHPRIDPVWFINNLTHAKGEAGGQPFRLRPWQKRIVQQIFKRRKDGLRQYRTALLMLPRKNGKSELAAAIALYGLLADGEIGAEVY